MTMAATARSSSQRRTCSRELAAWNAITTAIGTVMKYAT
jgi:hypothetical protein